jgi:F-type H+-transporting ATPase subunit alpha
MVDTTVASLALPEVAARARTILQDAATAFEPTVAVEHGGRVEGLADGVVRLSGLDAIAMGDLVQIGSVSALVMDLAPSRVTAALLADSSAASRISIGQHAKRRGASPTVVVGDGLIGRVVDPLGAFLDGPTGTIEGRLMPLERPAPQIFERSPVHTPLYTGVLAIDGMFPIGRGQRELIAGDEGTGKTALVVDAILNQRSRDVVCVYAGIGQRRAETWRIVEKLKHAGPRFIVVSAPEDSSPALRYLAPYTATAIGEYFRDRGQHALVVYDDLSAHAVAWRELSLLLGRPPGREAYPGDVFFVHSRLLERSAQLADKRGGGSLTALPICSLESGRLTAYIPTNLVSITDGQLVMSTALFSAGQRPAIDAGLSVSRVGARAQSKLLSTFSANLKLEYASFLELEAFAKLGTRLEAQSARRLDWGRRTRALLRAEQGAPLGLVEELVRLSLTEQVELLVGAPEDDVSSFANGIAEWLLARHPSLEADLEQGSVSALKFSEWVAEQAARLRHG